MYIALDGNRILQLGITQAGVFKVPVGKHVIGARFSLGLSLSDEKAEFVAEPGQTYAFLCHTNVLGDGPRIVIERISTEDAAWRLKTSFSTYRQED